VFRRIFIGVLAAVILSFAPASAYRYASPPPISVGSLATFDAESAAQAHCPTDQVVWLNTNSGIYHEKGMRWYGRTRHGVYVCRTEANVAGDRNTRNGQ
jgi:hypothetical protein